MMHLEIIAIMSLAALGVWTAMGEGMALSLFREVAEDQLRPWIAKP